VSATCAKLGPGVLKYSCNTNPPSFQNDLNDAIETLKRERPDIFVNDYVVKVGAYYVGVIQNLDQKGICGWFDGEEIGLKSNNDFHESYDILSAQARVRRYYLGTCSPAAIPIPGSGAPSLPANAGCPLPASREIACGQEPEGHYYNDVAGAIDQLLKEKPELFDYTDVSNVTEWPRVTNMKAYIQAVQDILVKKGYCATYDGEEMPIKRTNDFSESYAIKYADKYIRKGKGIYRGSCYPAGF
jgi:hypothetical protein